MGRGPGAGAEARGQYWTGENPHRISRQLKLYSRCARAYLQLYYRHIDANGIYNSPLGNPNTCPLLSSAYSEEALSVDWRMQSEANGSRLRIQHVKFAKYLCFNRRKRLTARVHPFFLIGDV